MTQLDINCDMGESFGSWQMGHDAEVMPYITSANIACGGHAGDPNVMECTVRLALKNGVAIGAHPGYPDLAGFGRRVLPMTADELRLSILAQLGALYAVARSCRADLHHVKAHGALYNLAAISLIEADVLVAAVASFSSSLCLYCPPNSEMERAALDRGITIVPEGFIDRVYEPDGTLVSRTVAGSVHTEPSRAARQALLLANGKVEARDGTLIPMAVRTLCAHGDNSAVLTILPAVRDALAREGHQVAAFPA